MKRIITIAGSNSQNSINRKLLTYASGLLAQVEIISIDLNDYVLPMDILVMLTPRSGHTDPPKDFGQKDKLMTILQFFS